LLAGLALGGWAGLAAGLAASPVASMLAGLLELAPQTPFDPRQLSPAALARPLHPGGVAMSSGPAPLELDSLRWSEGLLERLAGRAPRRCLARAGG